jgi:hypothetical protein
MNYLAVKSLHPEFHDVFFSFLFSGNTVVSHWHSAKTDMVYIWSNDHEAQIPYLR